MSTPAPNTTFYNGPWNSSECEALFPSSTALGDYINFGFDNQSINITALAQSCNETVCPLVWGTPNADLSGIGTVISYMVQAGLIGLFGLYLVIPGLLGAIGFKYPQKIHRRFRAVNLLLAVSFFAAEVIHLRQSPGIAELDFMRTLADLQMVQYTVISYGMIACVGAFGNSYKTITFRELLRGGGGYRILDVIPPMLSAVYLSLDKSHYGDPGTWQEQAAATCPRSADYSAGLARQDPLGGVQLSCAGVSNLAWVWLFRAYIGIMGVQALYGAVVGAAWVVSGRGAGEPAFQETVRRHVTLFRLPAKVGLCLCIALTACFVLAVWMERACVDTVWGIDDDDEWGVGQVLALSAWAPTALDIVTWMVRCFRKRNELSSEDEKNSSGAQYLGVVSSSSGACSPAPPAANEGGKGPSPWA